MSISRRTLLGYGLTTLYVMIAVFAVVRDYRSGPDKDLTSGFTPADMRRHLKIIAQEPHPSGTRANERVRRYIVGELRRMGVKYESLPRFIARSGFLNIHIGGRVRNVLARIPGKPGTHTLLVMAHFDSRPFAVGANDDGAAIAAMLETIRVIKAGPVPRNNIIFLFTDGEELGLLGARAFLRSNVYAQDVDLVLNFEGRGRTGPSILFETSGADSGLVSAFARRAPDPVGTSLAAGVYRLMPNDTDFSPFRKRGIPGLNFAYMGDISAYHTMLDNYASLDDRTLRHQGRTMLAMTRSFAERDLSNPGKDSATFFNLDELLVHYSNFAARCLAIAAVFAWMVCVALGFRRRSVTAASLARGFALTTAGMVSAAVLVFVLRWVIGVIHPEYGFMPNGDTYNVVWYRIAYTAAGITPALYLYGRFRGTGGMAGPLLGGLTWYALLTAVTGTFLPGAAYLFTWPLLICCASLLVAAYQEERYVSTGMTLLLYVVFTCAWTYVVSGTLLIAMEGLTLRLVVVVMPILVLALVPMFPIFDIIRLSLRPLLGIGLAVILVCMLGAGLSSGYDAEHPRPTSVVFAYNQDKGTAAWLSCDPAPDTWTGRFLTGEPGRGHMNEFLPVLQLCPGTMRRPFRVEAKTPRNLRGPRVTLLRDGYKKGVRTVRLRIKSSRDARGLHAFVDRRKVVLENVRVNGIVTRKGKSPEPKLGYMFLRRFIRFEKWESFLVYAVPSTGYTLEFSLRARDYNESDQRPVLKLLVVDQTPGLGATGIRIPPRPADSMPASGKPLYDSVLVSRRYEFR